VFAAFVRDVTEVVGGGRAAGNVGSGAREASPLDDSGDLPPMTRICADGGRESELERRSQAGHRPAAISEMASQVRLHLRLPVSAGRVPPSRGWRR
jgi:hypothetical protein